MFFTSVRGDKAISQHVTDLRTTAKSCGSSSHSTREALLREVNISLMTKARLKLMCEENKPAKVDAIRERDKAQKKRNARREKEIQNWSTKGVEMSTHHEGVQHLANKAKTVRKIGRYARICNANVYVIKQKSSLLAECILITKKRMTEKQTSGPQMWKRRMKTKNFKLDTGAQAMVLSFNLLKKLRKTETLREARVRLQPPQARELQSEENALCRWNPERKCMSSLSLWWKEKWRQFWVWRCVNRGAR